MSDEQERVPDVRYRTNPLPSKWPPPYRDTERPIPTRTVALTCSHTNVFEMPAPRPGERAYCRSCRDFRRVSAQHQPSVQPPDR